MELELRRRCGEQPTPREYRARFPGDGDLIDDVFGPAPPRSPAGRPPARGPAEAEADRNLLFGILALQNNFIDRDALLAAFNAWVADKARPWARSSSSAAP